MKDACIFKSSTALADIRIEQVDDELRMKFNADTDATQSVISIDSPHQLIMPNLQYLMGILLFVPEPKEILLLGVGGGSLIHFFQYYLPNCKITAVEYNPELLDIARQHFKLPGAAPNLRYVIDDARNFLAEDRGHYDLIVVDIFEDNLSPSWLQQELFIQQLRSRLTRQGGVSCNLLIRDEKSFKQFYRLFRQEFKRQTLCIDAEDYENLLVYGVNFLSRQKSMSSLLQASWQLAQHYEFPFTPILSAIYDINPVDSGMI